MLNFARLIAFYVCQKLAGWAVSPIHNCTLIINNFTFEDLYTSKAPLQDWLHSYNRDNDKVFQASRLE